MFSRPAWETGVTRMAHWRQLNGPQRGEKELNVAGPRQEFKDPHGMAVHMGTWSTFGAFVVSHSRICEVRASQDESAASVAVVVFTSASVAHCGKFELETLKLPETNVLKDLKKVCKKDFNCVSFSSTFR